MFIDNDFLKLKGMGKNLDIKKIKLRNTFLQTKLFQWSNTIPGGGAGQPARPVRVPGAALPGPLRQSPSPHHPGIGDNPGS